MYNQQLYHELQARSHVRGKLNKQFYYIQKQQQQKKRRQMRTILDQQIKQKKLQKQKLKLQENIYLIQQENSIKAHQLLLENRQKHYFNSSTNNSRAHHQPTHSNSAQGIYQPNSKNNSSGMYQSRVSAQENYILTHQKSKNRSRSRAQFENDSGDIPVMPLLKYSQNKPLNQLIPSHHNLQQKQPKPLLKPQNPPIPLLDLGPQEQKKKKSKKLQHLKKDQKQKYFIQKLPKDKKIAFLQNPSNSRQNTQLKDIFHDINQQLQQQNKQLRRQLKKKQQAISLLLGAVKSNNKLDKFRIQAQKILHGQNTLDNKIVPITQINTGSRRISTRQGRDKQKQQRQSMLPKLKLKNQSIMHDYMFGSAKKAYQIKSKTFK